jgi:hypothetical protein
MRSLATHRLPLEQAPDGYRMFRAKADCCIKVSCSRNGGPRHAEHTAEERQHMECAAERNSAA